MTKKEIATILIAAICFIGAAVVAASGNEGWGWFIFVGIVALLDVIV